MNQATAQRPSSGKALVVAGAAETAAALAEIDRRYAILEQSAAKLIDPQRMRGVFLSAFSRDPKLWDCSPVSVARSVIEIAQMGLEPTGAIGGAHLVARWNGKTRQLEAGYIIDYRGLVTLAKRSDEIARITARVVREQDIFDYSLGSDEWVKHKPALVADPGPYTYAYSIAFYRDGAMQCDVMSAAQLIAHRERFAPRDKQGHVTGPWVTDEPEMWKKTVLRRLSKQLPLTIEARWAIEHEGRIEGEYAATRAGSPASQQLSRTAHRLISAPPSATVSTPEEPAAQAPDQPPVQAELDAPWTQDEIEATTEVQS